MDNFIGVKIALIKGDELLVIHRDNKPGLFSADLWDFAGGAREQNETIIECITREVKEELGIMLRPESIVWGKAHPAMHDPKLTGYFMVANITDEEIANIVFGDEGQGWKMMKIDDFMKDNTVIEQLKGRLGDYLEGKV